MLAYSPKTNGGSCLTGRFLIVSLEALFCQWRPTCMAWRSLDATVAFVTLTWVNTKLPPANWQRHAGHG